MKNPDKSIFNVSSKQRYLARDVYQKLKYYKSQTDLFNVVGILMFMQDHNVSADIFKFFKDQEQLFQFLEVFGGQTVKIPTIEEFMDNLKFCTFIYYFDILEKPFKDAVELSGLSSYDSNPGNLRKIIMDRREEILVDAANSQIFKGLRRNSNED